MQNSRICWRSSRETSERREAGVLIVSAGQRRSPPSSRHEMPQSFPRRKIEDAELERLLAAVLDHHESMPESLSDAAGALFGLRAVDEELAGLVEDSAERLTSGVREGAEHERVAVFATDRHTIELVIRDDAVLGQVVPEVQGAGQIWDASGMVV